MIRAEKARGKSDEDIPLARRVDPLWSSDPRKIWNYIVLPISALFFLILLFAGLYRVVNKFSLDFNARSKAQGEKALLGHYSYPEAKEDDLVDFYPGLPVHKEMLEDLIKMENEARKDGIFLVVLSGYRSIALQKDIFYTNKSLRNQIAIERAKVSAPPGYSEHSTGFAVDFGDRNRPETHFEVEFAQTDAFRWLKRHAPRYHFILSFPDGNKQGVSYEPWHWRYEGSVEALKLFDYANRKRRFDENQFK